MYTTLFQSYVDIQLAIILYFLSLFKIPEIKIFLFNIQHLVNEI